MVTKSEKMLCTWVVTSDRWKERIFYYYRDFQHTLPTPEGTGSLEHIWEECLPIYGS